MTTDPVAPDPAVAGEAQAQTSGDMSEAATERGRLVIHGAGDVSLDPGYLPIFTTEGYGHAFSGLAGLFASDSLTVVNLECPASTRGTALDKQFTFRCDPDALFDARAAGVDVVNLANNHILDFGIDAARDTIEHLATAGIAGVGIGEDSESAARPAFFDINGWTVAVVGFGGVVPSPTWLAADERFGMADGDDTASMVATVESAAEHADLVIVTIHWGVELDTEPRADDVARAEAMVAAGADMIFGHHSHRLNPLTMVDGTPVAWGLGNFVWPKLSAEGANTAIARVIVEADGAVSACLIPATIQAHGHPVPDGSVQDGCPDA
jgi:poly-gamma-glutamate synthesis protein (capsule biosynthesis protein)